MRPWDTAPSERDSACGWSALACSLHLEQGMVEAIRDQWVIVVGVAVVAAAVAWLIARR